MHGIDVSPVHEKDLSIRERSRSLGRIDDRHHGATVDMPDSEA